MNVKYPFIDRDFELDFDFDIIGPSYQILSEIRGNPNKMTFMKMLVPSIFLECNYMKFLQIEL